MATSDRTRAPLRGTPLPEPTPLVVEDGVVDVEGEPVVNWVDEGSAASGTFAPDVPSCVPETLPAQEEAAPDPEADWQLTAPLPITAEVMSRTITSRRYL